ncbi:hypothetical protein [Embleya scabrispora]|uniref:hypothetical protein n=1 Tax=Embleya scabrispora TaxID=159449 RepID=UPI0003628C0D|nr:hypothetical protein [Embleya scabrispora]
MKEKFDEDYVAALQRIESAEADSIRLRNSTRKPRYRLAQVPRKNSGDYVETFWTMAQMVDDNPLLDACIGKFMECFPSVTLIPEARRRLMNLVSLGLAVVHDDRILLTASGRRFVGSRDTTLLCALFLERIEGAVEAQQMFRQGLETTEIKIRLMSHPELEVSATQCDLLLRWFERLDLST